MVIEAECCYYQTIHVQIPRTIWTHHEQAFSFYRYSSCSTGNDWKYNNYWDTGFVRNKNSKKSQQPSEDITARPERQSQQPSEALGATVVRPDRQSQFSPEQQQEEDEIDAAIEQKDEQFTNVLQEDNANQNNNDDEELDDQIEIDKKAPIAISGDNVYIVWFNDQNSPNNNSEVLFRSSNDSGITFADKINLSNTTTADSINAEIAAEGNNVIITWWEGM